MGLQKNNEVKRKQGQRGQVSESNRGEGEGGRRKNECNEGMGRIGELKKGWETRCGMAERARARSKVKSGGDVEPDT